jgi:hypothetical protein
LKFSNLPKQAKATSEEHQLLWRQHSNLLSDLLASFIDSEDADNFTPTELEKFRDLARKQRSALQLHDETRHIQYMKHLQAVIQYYKLKEAFHLNTPEQEGYTTKKGRI